VSLAFTDFFLTIALHSTRRFGFCYMLCINWRRASERGR
jgi:hypothetical protein